MKNLTLRKYYLFSCASVLLLCVYPIAMGAYAAAEMLRTGAIAEENFPKYIIPYTPIAISLIFGTAMLPLFSRLRKWNFAAAALSAVTLFLLTEHLMETQILVKASRLVVLQSWQLALCYVPPDMFETRTWQAVDVLLGGYSPAFKLHFYSISIVLILSLLNSVYGFAQVLRTGDRCRVKALIFQTVCAFAFLGMCIWACFTSFYRTGELLVSPLSALLMSVFFILFGITMGIFIHSFLSHKAGKLFLLIPPAASMAVTLLMYLGEMILLNGNLYRFGTGFFFRTLPLISLAPVDLAVIAASGLLTFCLCLLLQQKPLLRPHSQDL